jgi:hypothetical protein
MSLWTQARLAAASDAVSKRVERDHECMLTYAVWFYHVFEVRGIIVCVKHNGMHLCWLPTTTVSLGSRSAGRQMHSSNVHDLRF